MALQEAANRMPNKIRFDRLAALDHSDLCKSVLEHNFPSSSLPAGKKRKRSSPMAIERLTLRQAQEWNATIWVMSPPCQPHTRQHSNQTQDLDDPRSKSFLHLCSLLNDMLDENLPRLLLMENVVGFEKVRLSRKWRRSLCFCSCPFLVLDLSTLNSLSLQSGSCKRWREVLSKRSYKVGHFHLTPTQVGIPNDRPRYFCLAVQEKEATKSEGQLVSHEDAQQPPEIQTSVPSLGVPGAHEVEVGSLPQISEFLDAEPSSLPISPKILESDTAWCFDIVTPEDQRSACFTQAYGKFVRGTGSVLYNGGGQEMTRFRLTPPEQRRFDPTWAKGLDLHKNLRYFSGNEVARLMGFPKSGFTFPAACTEKQRWKLLGNSLNVRVAALVCEMGLKVIL